MANNYLWLICRHCHPTVDEHGFPPGGVEKTPEYLEWEKERSALAEAGSMAGVGPAPLPWVGALIVAKYSPESWSWGAEKDTMNEWLEEHQHYEDRRVDSTFGPTCYTLAFEAPERFLDEPGSRPTREEADALVRAKLVRGSQKPQNREEEVIHLCPPEGSGVFPCCGQTPFEAVGSVHRMTMDPGAVTCRPSEEILAARIHHLPDEEWIAYLEGRSNHRPHVMVPTANPPYRKCRVCGREALGEPASSCPGS